MKSCFNCQHKRVCEIHSKLMETTSKGLKHQILAPDQTEDHSIWMGIYGAVGRSCKEFSPDYSFPDTMTKDIEDFSSKMLEEFLADRDEDEKKALHLLSPEEKKKELSDLISSHEDEIEALLSSHSLDPDEHMESLELVILSYFGY